ncbi:unnamed protein product [Nesidiocoris tenuis]|uniref:UBX domain-containing protein n=1 Tax=Nesidiocoris tenuis TaxID=355587 RepID=A0A6H5HKT6_9HEMI|nr:unnamed protein product [Nesidiocoris tenuis]
MHHSHGLLKLLNSSPYLRYPPKNLKLLGGSASANCQSEMVFELLCFYIKFEKITIFFRWGGPIGCMVSFVFQFCYNTFMSILKFAFSIFWREPRRQVTDPVGDVLKFIDTVNENYSRNHPVFYQGSYGQALNDAKQELRISRSLTQRIRREQDAAYLESLRVDQEKERRKNEEQEKKMQALREQEEREQAERDRKESIKRAKIEMASDIPDEPESSHPDALSIVFKLPSGERIERRFLKTHKLKQIAKFSLPSFDWNASSSTSRPPPPPRSILRSQS